MQLSDDGVDLVASDEFMDNSTIASGQSLGGVAPSRKIKSTPKIISGKGKKNKASESPSSSPIQSSPAPGHKPNNVSVVIDQVISGEDAADVSEIDRVLADLRSVTAADDSTGYSN